MKIGIISINIHTKVLNPASPLHSVCFQQFLKSHGIDSTIIDYKPVYYGKADPRHPLYYQQKHPEPLKKVQKYKLDKWERLFTEREKRYDRFEEFIDKYYKKTEKVYTAGKLDKEDPGFDLYICVTDVIWKYNFVKGFDRGFFLACKQMEGKKKIAYSASRGATKYSPEQREQFFEYIRDMDYISVREESLYRYIKDNSNLEVSLVLDPVFLMEAPFYHEMAIRPKEEKYVLIYLAMEPADSLVRMAVAYAKKHDMKVIELSEFPEHEKLARGVDYQLVYDIGVEEWIGYIQDSQMLFTNSFHACCLSVIMHKQFIAGDRQGDKIDNILNTFDLSYRRVKNYNPNKCDQLKPIDYEVVEGILEKKRKESQDFILHAIEDLQTREHRPHELEFAASIHEDKLTWNEKLTAFKKNALKAFKKNRKK